MRKSILLILFTVLFCTSLISQPSKGGYNFVKELDARLQRKLMANELLFDNDGEYLVINFGNAPSYIVVFSTKNWEPVYNYRLPNWVDFTGAYIDKTTHDLYILEARYSSKYYKLNLITGAKSIVPCSETPNGCTVIEPKKPVKSLYSPDKKYFVKIKKNTQREVYLYEIK